MLFVIFRLSTVASKVQILWEHMLGSGCKGGHSMLFRSGSALGRTNLGDPLNLFDSNRFSPVDNLWLSYLESKSSSGFDLTFSITNCHDVLGLAFMLEIVGVTANSFIEPTRHGFPLTWLLILLGGPHRGLLGFDDE